MSVLRKRSPWIIPTVGLSAGLLALGLAGCGGGGTETLPAKTVISVIPSQTGGTPDSTTTGSSTTTATVTTTTDSTKSGGLTSVTISAQGSTSLDGLTLGVQAIPQSDSAIQKLIDAKDSGGVKQVLGTFTFGAVGSDGKIDLSRPIVFAGSVTTTISLAALQAALANGSDSITVAVYDSNGNLVGSHTYNSSDIAALENSATNGVVTITITTDGDGTTTLSQGYFTITAGSSSTTGHGQGGVS